MQVPSLAVFEVSRASNPAQRHAALRHFQDTRASGPRVFATTFATAAVGLTLTAASRVYLLEASLDPAQARPPSDLLPVSLKPPSDLPTSSFSTPSPLSL